MDENDTNADAAALAAAKAGYERRAGVHAPASPSADVPAQPLADATASPAPAADAPVVDDDPESNLEAEAAAPAPASSTAAPDAISQQLEDVKAQIRELRAQGTDQATVNRLFGEIGGITRVVKKLQQQLAPTENELAGAITAAEKAAQEYPEFGGPMLDALKALASKLPQKTEDPEEPEPQPTAAPVASPQPTAAPAPADPYTPEQKVQIKLLNELHPDRLDLNKSPDFQKWLSAKPADFRDRFTKTWDFAFIAKGYSEFKAAQATAKRKADRLAAAATPQGTAHVPQATALSDTDAAKRGYARYRQR